MLASPELEPFVRRSGPAAASSARAARPACPARSEPAAQPGLYSGNRGAKTSICSSSAAFRFAFSARSRSNSESAERSRPTTSISPIPSNESVRSTAILQGNHIPDRLGLPLRPEICPGYHPLGAYHETSNSIPSNRKPRQFPQKVNRRKICLPATRLNPISSRSL